MSGRLMSPASMPVDSRARKLANLTHCLEFRVQDLASNSIPTIVITGPTASGKTALALALADRFPCQLISVDSSMVYRQLNIGSAKPDTQILQRYPHRLVDIRDINQPYSAGDFVDDARAAIATATANRKIPVLVGGTLLYLRALFQGLAALPAADPAIRAALEAEAAESGWDHLYQQLQQVDPEAAKKIAPADRQRIQRALEVYRLTGKAMSDWQSESRQAQRPSPLKFILTPPDRAVLHRRIAERSQQMLAEGLVAEVRLIRDQGFSEQSPALRAVGYRQVLEHLDGQLEESALPERITIATRQLAKRQLTWLRSEPAGFWFDPLAVATLERVTRIVLEAVGKTLGK